MLRTSIRPFAVWLYLFTALAALLVGCTRPPAFSSRYAAVLISVDGNTSEWPNEVQYDQASRLQYQVLNDKATFYLRLIATDQATQRQIMRRGLTVWLDSTGRNQQQLGVHFPLGVGAGNKMASVLNRGASPGMAEPEAERELVAVSSLKEMELLHYKGAKEPLFTDAHSRTGVQGAAAVNSQGDLTYELAVPLQLLYAHGAGPKDKAVVGIILEAGKLSAPTSRPGSGGRGGMGGGRPAGGGGGGGRRPGGGGAGRGAGGPGGSTPRALSLKTRVAIATAP